MTAELIILISIKVGQSHTILTFLKQVILHKKSNTFFINQENTQMHYEMIQTISDLCRHICPASSLPNIYT